MTKRALRVKEQQRRRIAVYRKQTFVEQQLVFRDLARLADVSWSMADKYMNGRRASQVCDRAFETLTGKPAEPEVVAA